MPTQNSSNNIKNNATKDPNLDYNFKLDSLNKKLKSKDSDFIYGHNEVPSKNLLEKLDNYLIEAQSVSLKEKAFFYHLFAVLMNAGISTNHSLQILANKTENRKFQRILNTISFDVEKGESLSRSMEKFPQTFTHAEIGVIKSGEATGSLDHILKRLSDQTEEQNDLITQLKSALTYPSIIFAILGVAIFIMFGFVIPKLVSLFIENNIELPTVTKVFLVISNIVKGYWFLLISGIIILGIILNSYFQTESGKFNLDLLKLKTGIIGPIYQKVYLNQIFSTLGLLLDAGVPLQETISIVTMVIDNEVYKLKLLELKIQVQAGEKISENLLKSPFLFPETVCKMLEIGERSASLSEMSFKISTQYLGEVRYTLKNLSSIIGPVVIVVVGAFVSVFALAILGPVFKLSEGLI